MVQRANIHIDVMDVQRLERQAEHSVLSRHRRVRDRYSPGSKLTNFDYDGR